MEDIRRILVVGRTTKADKKAFLYGVSLARAARAELALMYVLPDSFGAENGKPAAPLPEDDRRRNLARAKRGLEDLAALEQAGGLGVKKLIKEGPFAGIIVKTALEEHIDLLIIPAYEEGKIEHYLFCRGITDLIHKLPCSILLVKEDGLNG